MDKSVDSLTSKMENDQSIDSSKKNENFDRLDDLDEEIVIYEDRFFAKPTIEPNSSTAGRPKILQRIFSSLREKFTAFSPDDDPPMPTESSASARTSTATLNNPTPESSSITCRICERSINETELEEHTLKCSQYQDCLACREKCRKYLHLLLKSMSTDSTSFGGGKLEDCAKKAYQIDEEQGKVSSIRLAKLLYKLAKFSSKGDLEAAMLRRIRYLVEQKKIIADRFANLHLKSPELYLANQRGNASHENFYSSCTDSSLESTPNRSNTPIGKLSTLLSTLLNLAKGKTGGDCKHRNHSTPNLSNINSSASSGGKIKYSLGTKSAIDAPNITQFEIIKPISRGAFGRVYLAKKKSTQDLFAIKVIQKDELIRKNMTNQALSERKMMSLAKTPSIVSLYYAFESKDCLFLVMEYLQGGDFASILQRDGAFAESVVRFYMAQLVETISYLHKHDIIHRDIKPDNMLLDCKGHLKLTDFGLANFSRKQSTPSLGSKCQKLGTPEYIAPEIIVSNGLSANAHDPAVDWWALGVCMFEFFFGVTPFSAETPEEVFTSIRDFNGIAWETFENRPSPNAEDLINRLLERNPQLRISVDEIKGHLFFQDTEWSNLRSATAPIIPWAIDAHDTSNFDARNSRYSEIGLPSDFLDAEPITNNDDASGFNTPLKFGEYDIGGGHSCRSSPFEGFTFKNIDVLGEANHRTITNRRASGAFSDSNLSTVKSSTKHFNTFDKL